MIVFVINCKIDENYINKNNGNSFLEYYDVVKYDDQFFLTAFQALFDFIIRYCI